MFPHSPDPTWTRLLASIHTLLNVAECVVLGHVGASLHLGRHKGVIPSEAPAPRLDRHRPKRCSRTHSQQGKHDPLSSPLFCMPSYGDVLIVSGWHLILYQNYSQCVSTNIHLAVRLVVSRPENKCSGHVYVLRQKPEVPHSASNGRCCSYPIHIKKKATKWYCGHVMLMSDHRRTVCLT